MLLIDLIPACLGISLDIIEITTAILIIGFAHDVNGKPHHIWPQVTLIFIFKRLIYIEKPQ